MRRTAIALALLTLASGLATAAQPGFITDFGQAKAEARDTGKLIFVYFNLQG